MRKQLSLAILALPLMACRGSSGNAADATGGSNVDSGSGAVTIYDIQMGTIPTGTPVTLNGVVVTAIDTYGSHTGNFWVEEPAGGIYSGVLVYNAPLAQVAALNVGDVVSITGGQHDEFALSTDTSGLTDTELDAPKGGVLSVVKTGTGTVPPPVAVDALAIGQMATATERDAAWEPFEGVLVTVTTTHGGLTVLSDPKSYSTGSDDEQDFDVNGGAVAEDEMAPFPTVAAGDCLGGITGIVDYFFTYNLLPRTTADVATGGTSCPPPEVSAGASIGLCGDGIDNDGNGFTDCADLGCEVGSGAWLDPTNCNAGATTCGCSMNLAAADGANKVTAGAAPVTGPVILNSEIITAIGPKGFWVADAVQAAANGGVFVFLDAAPVGVAVGNTVTVQGIAGPFTLSKATGAASENEISKASVLGTPSGNSTPKALTGQTAATLTDITNGEPFTGVLVSLSDIKVTAVPDSFGNMQVVDKVGTAFTVGAGAFPSYTGATTTVGTCYTTLTGVMDLDSCATGSGSDCTQTRTLNPRSVADMPTGSGC